MDTEQPQPQPQLQQSGPYDLVLFIAKSFGSALPFVVVIVMVAVGSWYFISELNTLQTKLIDAERKLATAKVEKAKAEGAAQSAADKARGDIMAEQAEQLSQLNDKAVSVSKKIQELVSGQLENMGRLEARVQAQASAALNQQKKTEELAKAAIDKLEKQVAELKERRKVLESEIALADYQTLKENFIKTMNEIYFSPYTLRNSLVLFRAKLKNQIIRDTVEKDYKDEKLSWRYRLMLLTELYRISEDKEYVGQIDKLLKTKKTELDSTVGQYFQGNSQWSNSAKKELSKLAIKWISDESMPIAVRDSFFDAIGYGVPVDQLGYSFNEKSQISRVLGRFVVKASKSAKSEYDCNMAFGLLKDFSSEAADVYADYIIKNTQNNEHAIKCISSFYGDGKSLPNPTEEQLKQWKPIGG